MGLTKATIEVLDDDAVQPGKLERFLDVQFNPTEYTLTKGAQIAEIAIPGIDSPILQFVRGQNEKLTLELFFDTTRERHGRAARQTSRDLTEPVYQLVKIQPHDARAAAHPLRLGPGAVVQGDRRERAAEVHAVQPAAACRCARRCR